MQHSSLIMNEGMPESPLVHDVFCSSLILITVCSPFVFMFVRGGRWIFCHCDVKIKKVLRIGTFISYCERKQKERHWKSLVVAEDRSLLYS